jgi:hypothetical protein
MDEEGAGTADGAEKNSVTGTDFSAGRFRKYTRPAEKHMARSPAMMKGRAESLPKN